MQALSAQSHLAVNAWDAAFYAFGNPETLYLVLSSLFLCLVCDLVPDPYYFQWVMLRLGSRRLWWSGKILTLTVSVGVYITLLLGIFIAIVTPALPWQTDWSAYAQRSFISLGLHREALQVSPWFSFAQLILLLSLGWLCLGLLMMVVTLCVRRNTFGLVVGAATVVGSYVGAQLSFANPQALAPFLKALLVHNHFELTPLNVPYRSFPIAISILYWLIWSLILTGTGALTSHTYDHLALN